MMLQANVSAPSPFRSTSPDTKMPTAQPVSIRLAKNAASAKPSAHRLKPKKADRQQRDRHHADRKADDAHDHQGGDELGGAQRRDQQVAEIARIHLLEERDRESELSAEQDVPQQHRADQDAAGLARTCSPARRCRSAGSPTSASARPASRSARSGAGRTSAAGTNSAAPSRRCGATRRMHVRAHGARLAVSRAARDVEEHFLQRVAAVAREQAGRRVVVLDAALLHEDHALAQALDFRHVVRGDQQRRAARCRDSARAAPAPSRRCRDRARRSARRAAAGRAR